MGDEMTLNVVLENGLGRAANAKIQTILTGDLDFSLTKPGEWNASVLDEQAFEMGDEDRSVAQVTFSVTKASFDAGSNSITVEEVSINGRQRGVAIASPSYNQTFRLVFRLLIWNEEVQKYVAEWNDGLEDHSSWLQVWFELEPEAGE
ncbi:MAG: hypothetical protein JTT11_06845 [Candidatus Brockarchaeota archaeon]|nr:hypothetical protein [Candidatus Brockarchaeota archaeon]